MTKLLRVGVVVGLLMVAGKVCVAQIGSQVPPSPSQTRPNGRPTLPSIDGSDPDGSNPLAARQESQRVKSIANERQKRIVEGTARLLQIAKELQEATAGQTKEQSSAEAIRKVEEIEKLARDVKQRTKS